MKAAAILIAALASTLLITAPAQSRTWHVTSDGTGEAPTIQAAFDSAQAGDAVLLAPGTYSWTSQGTGDHKIGASMIEAKAGVSLRGEGAPETTILDAEGHGRVILCQDVGEMRIEGLTVTRGAQKYASETPNGGGICSLGNSRPTISNCIVCSNYIDRYIDGYGGGIYAEQASIVDCEIFGNSISADGGGAGIGIRGGSITRCTIRGNYAGFGSISGVGVYAERTTITDCEVFDNSAGPLGYFAGGGIAITEGSISGCTIRNNRVGSDYYINSAGGISALNTRISDCRIEGNSVWSNDRHAVGGGASLFGGSVTRCIFIGNGVSGSSDFGEMDRGGAIACEANTRISDCIFVGNNATLGDAIAGAQVVITRCTLLGGIYVEVAGSVSYTIVARAACSGPIVFSCTNLYGNTEGDILCGADAGGNFSADPQFCAVDPATSMNFTLQADSPCAPGNHPDGLSCGPIGAAPVGCGTVSVTPTTWSRLKSLYR